MKSFVTALMSIPFLLAIAALAAVGCSGGSPDVGLVTGTVTLDGEPLENAEVVFAPASGRPSTGLTDSSGRYELTYIRDVKGAVPGPHTVRITTRPEPRADDYQGPAFREPIPGKYNTDTELTANVEPGPNTFDFDLQLR